jgi:hypothetical protein
MYLVFSAVTSRPTSLLASIRVPAEENAQKIQKQGDLYISNHNNNNNNNNNNVMSRGYA